MLNNPFNWLMIIEPEKQNTPKYPVGNKPSGETAHADPLQRTSGMAISPEDDIICLSAPARNRRGSGSVKQKDNVADKQPLDTEEGI